MSEDSSEALHLLHLPDELLVEVLSKLDLKDRHKALPLVCRRLGGLLCSRRLLRHVSLTTDLSSLDAARSLLGWLATGCAGRMHRLQLSLTLKGMSDDFQPNDYCSEVASHLSAALAACGTASGLAELDVELRGSSWTTLHVGSWAASLRGLTRLRFGVDCELRLSGRLGGLTHLQVLEFEGKPTRVASFAALPASLTHFKLGSTDNENGDSTVVTLPLQVTSLTQLRRLILVERYHTSDAATAYQPLAALTATLEHLHMEACSQLPPCLGQLTAVRSLVLELYDGWVQEQFEVLSQALPELQHLSRLVLAPLSESGVLSWPAGNVQALPLGTWLASLRQLAAPASLLAAHLPALAAAGQLQHLAIVTARKPGLEPAVSEQEAAEAVLRWAAGHAPLRRLVLQMGKKGCPLGLLRAIVEAQRAKPALLLEFNENVTAELIDCDAV